MKISYGTDVGVVRNDNQDSVFTKVFSDNLGVFIVADGMGGYVGGKFASSRAVEYISEYICSEIQNYTENDDIGQLLRQAVSKANREIYNISQENDEYRGMGTTVVVSVVSGKMLYTASVGDSREYLYSKNSLKQITNDHSLVANLLSRGLITKDEARVHPQKNIITRAVGSEDEVTTDIFVNKLKKNDVILLCSDGLHSMVSEADIKKILKSGDNDMAQRLISLANESGGRDNISVITVKIVGEEK